MPSAQIAALYIPFQIPYIPEEGLHHTTIVRLMDEHPNGFYILLPVKRFPVSAVSPLDFKMRETMIHERFPNVKVLPVPDQKYPENRIAALEEAMASVGVEESIKLYCDPEFAELYNAHSTKWTAGFLDWSFKVIENAMRDISTFDANWSETEAFRRGMVYAMAKQYPISWFAVDIAITRTLTSDLQGILLEKPKVQVLLGRKPGEKNWRFPGGFKDRSDDGLEPAVFREANEETNSDLLTTATYIGSKNVNDWRYRGERDGVTTAFFHVAYYGKTEPVAGDDLEEIKWFDADTLSFDLMEGEHKILLTMLKTALGVF